MGYTILSPEKQIRIMARGAVLVTLHGLLSEAERCGCFVEAEHVRNVMKVFERDGVIRTRVQFIHERLSHTCTTMQIPYDVWEGVVRNES